MVAHDVEVALLQTANVNFCGIQLISFNTLPILAFINILSKCFFTLIQFNNIIYCNSHLDGSLCIPTHTICVYSDASFPLPTYTAQYYMIVARHVNFASIDNSFVVFFSFRSLTVVYYI